MTAILLTLQGIVFPVWAFLMFRTLFRLRRLAAGRSGALVPGVGATLGSWGAFLRRPEWRTDRRLLGLATLALVVIIALQVVLATR